MNITYREYTPEDKNLLVTMARKLTEHSKAIDPLKRVINSPGYVEADVEDMLGDVENHHGKVWFAESEGSVVGYVIGVIWDQSEKNKLEIGPHKLGQVLDLFIDESMRGQGLGSKFLSMMEKYFKDEGCDSMWVNTNAHNQPARNLYKKFGFVDRELGLLKNI
jgi:ribosomal protein S18 acetylase RimI-like enzyme